MRATASTLDASAVGLSCLCLVHCLLLPIVSAALPAAGLWAEAEWLHKLLVLTALPVTALAAVRHREGTGGLPFLAPAILGLALLLSAAFVEALHDFETSLTVAGAVLLASAHIWRWGKRRKSLVGGFNASA